MCGEVVFVMRMGGEKKGKELVLLLLYCTGCRPEVDGPDGASCNPDGGKHNPDGLRCIPDDGRIGTGDGNEWGRREAQS
jgi:hypothetical protein